jgi:hypothetical protein
MLEYALYYAKRGWAVIPLLPNTKIPLTSNGSKDATTNLDTIAAWWANTPDANIGIVMNAETGMFALDIDPRNGGDESWDNLCIGYDVPDTLEVRTPTGGRHFYFEHPGEKLRGKLKEYPGIDVQQGGKYVVAPPSVHPDGGRYAFFADNLDARVEVLTDGLRELLLRPEQPEHPAESSEPDPNDTRPGTRFARENTWAEILEPAGWTVSTVDHDGEVMWTRPGKDEGISASTGYQGNDLLWVFTSSTEFEPDTSYTKFGAYAMINFDGDHKAAGQHLAEQYELQGGGAKDVLGAFQMARTIADVDEAEFSFDAAFPQGTLVSDYIEYASMLTDASPEYHEAGVLTLLSTLAHGIRAELAPYPNGLPLNLYLSLVGGSTRSRKSTAQGITASVLKGVHPKALLPSRMTGEAAIYTMAGRDGQPSLWTPDEFGVLLSQIFKRDFMRPLEELMLSLYGGEEYSYRTVRETVKIKDPHLVILAACTPESLALAGPGALLGGLLPRFGIVFPGSIPPARPVLATAGVDGLRDSLQLRLRRLLGVLHDPGKPIKGVTFEPEAASLLGGVEASLTGHVSTERLPMMLYKVAALSALSEERDNVTVADAQAASIVVGRWAAGAKRLQPFLRQRAQDLEMERMLDAVRAELIEGGGAVHRAKLSRQMKLDKNTANKVRDTLVEWGYVYVAQDADMGDAETWVSTEVEQS